MASTKQSRLELLQKLTRDRIEALPVKDKRFFAENHPLSVSPRTSSSVPRPTKGASDLETSGSPHLTSTREGQESSNIKFPDASETPAQWGDRDTTVIPSIDSSVEDQLERGQIAPTNQPFCSLHKLSHFLDLGIVDHTLFSGTRSGFFIAKNFWGRPWQLYYVHPMKSSAPIIVIPENEFKAFLMKILSSFRDSEILANPALDLLSVANMQVYRDADLLIDFPDHPRFTPRYLGLCKSIAEYESLLRKIPSKDFRIMSEANDEPIDEDDVITFDMIIKVQAGSVSPQADLEARVAKEKAEMIAKKKAKKKEGQAAKRKAMNDMFKRAQTYLGMRPDTDDDSQTPLPKLSPSSSIPFPPSKQTVFISFDVESWERNHNIITEVGLAIFSTEHLSAHPAPDKTASNWHKLIEAHHFRIIEHSRYQNSQFVRGNAYGFKFGESQEVSIADCSLIIEDLFDELGASGQIVLVGHAVAGDIAYMDKLGFNPARHAKVIDTLDTQSLWRALNAHSQASDGVGLARLLAECELDYGGLHNAGNDAVYTMRTLLAMMVLEGTLRPE